MEAGETICKDEEIPFGKPRATRRVHVNIWGLRFYKKIKFGVCELQLMKNYIFGVRELK